MIELPDKSFSQLSGVEDRMIPPGATLGVLGSGQLGRMFALAARRMGYRVHTFSPGADTPTGQVADLEISAPYEDLDAARAFARNVDAVTFEFENVPAATVEAVARIIPARPGGEVLHTTQHRIREKTFLARHGFPVTQFRRVTTREDLRAALEDVGFPAILKTADFGYDGKGQQTINAAGEADAAFDALAGREGILEAFVAFERELSVVAARACGGAVASYGVIENTHARHILDHSIAPARVSNAVAREAEEIARALLSQLDYVGVLCVELFLTSDEKLFVNELAPRPHNSGHYTIDACATSQFEQQVRALCNLPLGSTEQVRPAAMANLLGDLWHAGEPDWRAALAVPGVQLHLYGKSAPRPGRKMGHITAHAPSTDEALRTVLAARDALTRR
ncbi:MAG: 5-(carboxyamino)imidazole ribonucleotide synthase [Acidobacteriota bacterium]|nr:5-(carboxyamino)imidazole ribonucleotide synthase [Acidobacteriota bacterium]